MQTTSKKPNVFEKINLVRYYSRKGNKLDYVYALRVFQLIGYVRI